MFARLNIKFLVAGLLLANVAVAQDGPCEACGNVGFERGSFCGWEGYHGSTSKPMDNHGFITGTINDTISRHTLMTKGNYDPKVPSLPCVNPNGGVYSVRLGNSNIHKEAEALSYTFVVDSSNTNFVYNYAVVFQDPGHDPSEQPYFSVYMESSDGTRINCASYQVSAQQGLAGFHNAGDDIIYKDWTAVSIPLQDFIGDTMTIFFVNKDCSRGQHFGYAYLDAQCGKLSISTIGGDICAHDTSLLIAPDGFSKYRWNTGDSTQSIRSFESGIYTVTLTTATNCEIVQEVELKKEKRPKISFDFDFNCEDSTLTVTDKSVSDVPLKEMIWELDGVRIDNLGQAVHKFLSGGMYWIKLSLLTENNCFYSDSMQMKITIPPHASIGPDRSMCVGDTVHITPDAQADTYQWSTGETSSAIVVQDSGWYGLLMRFGPCFVSDSVFITVNHPPVIDLGRDTSLCPGDSMQIGEIIPEVVYNWRSGSHDPIVTVRDSGFFFLSADYRSCVTVDSIRVTITPRPDPELGPDFLACVGDRVTLNANSSVGESYEWNTGQSGPSIQGLSTGTYWVKVRNGHCEASDTVTFEFRNPPNLKLNPVNPFCVGDLQELSSLTDAVSPDYRWNTGAATSSISVEDGGWYTLVIKDTACEVSDSIYLTAYALPVVKNLFFELCSEDTARFELDPLYSYLYESLDTVEERMIKGGQEYYFQAVDTNDCKSDLKIIAKLAPYCEEELYVPNAFTPNDDGYNEVFKFEYFGLHPRELKIFNRWGTEIYTSTDPNKGWDGKLNGEICKPDVYIWKLMCQRHNGNRKEFTGTINLIK